MTTFKIGDRVVSRKYNGGDEDCFGTVTKVEGDRVFAEDWTVGSTWGSLGAHSLELVSPAAVSLKDGDQVRVVRKIAKQDGWNDGWVSSMDELVGDGKTYAVRRVTAGDVYLAGSAFSWPSGALEKVEAAVPAFKVGDRLSIADAGIFADEVRVGDPAAVTSLGERGYLDIQVFASSGRLIQQCVFPGNLRFIEPAPLTIEAGKSYVAVNGETIGPMIAHINDLFIRKVGDCFVWNADGSAYCVGSGEKIDYRLIAEKVASAEAADEPAVLKVGDKVRSLVAECDVTAGNLYEVTYGPDADGDVRVRDDRGATHWLWKRQYEAVTAEAEALPTVKVGDRIRALVDDCDVSKGTIYEVKALDEDDGEVTIIDDVGDRWRLDCDEYEIVTDEAAAPAFKVGDRVKASSDRYIGDIARSGEGVILEVDIGPLKVIEVDLKGGQRLAYSATELTLLPAADTAAPAFKVGDKVRALRPNRSVDVTGQIGEVITVDTSDNTLRIDFDTETWWQDFDAVELVTDTPTAANDNAINPELAEGLTEFAAALEKFAATLKRVAA